MSGLIFSGCVDLKQRSDTIQTKFLVWDSKVIHDCFELILRCQTGIQQIAAFGFPFMETTIVEHFEVVRNNERYDVVS